jgi:hypothetical protein
MKHVFFKKLNVLLVILSMNVVIVGCSGLREKREVLTCKNAHQQVAGMDKKKALEYIKESGFKSRILGEDGQSFIGTHDYRTDRMNLFIDDGKVSAIRCG